MTAPDTAAALARTREMLSNYGPGPIPMAAALVAHIDAQAAQIDVLAGALRAAQSVLIEANSPTGIGEYEIDDAIHTAAAALAKIGGAE